MEGEKRKKSRYLLPLLLLSGVPGDVCSVDPRAQCLSSLPSPHDTILPSYVDCSLPLPLCPGDENSSSVTNPGRLHNPFIGVGSLQDGSQGFCFPVITPLYNPLFLNVGWIYWLTSTRIHRRAKMTLLRWSYEKAVNSILAILTWITCLGEANCYAPEQPYAVTTWKQGLSTTMWVWKEPVCPQSSFQMRPQY